MLKARNFCNLTAAAAPATAVDVGPAGAGAVAVALAKNLDIQQGKKCGNRLSCWPYSPALALLATGVVFFFWFSGLGKI